MEINKQISQHLELAHHHAEMEMEYFKLAFIKPSENIPFDVTIDLHKEHREMRKFHNQEADKLLSNILKLSIQMESVKSH